MKIDKMLEELRFVDESTQIKCCIPAANIQSRIYAVGRVQPESAGVVLGDREPELREKTAGTFIKELKSFGADYQCNDFLFEATHELNGESYELRYYQLTHIETVGGELVLNSVLEELIELREHHLEPEHE